MRRNTVSNTIKQKTNTKQKLLCEGCNEGNEERGRHEITVVPKSYKHEQYNAIVKCVFLGGSKTGKTLLLTTISHGNNLINNNNKTISKRNSYYNPTFGVDFRCIDLKHVDTNIKFQCWDVPGEKEYQVASIDTYLYGSDIILLFCDVNVPHEIINWLNRMEISKYINKQNKVFLICDGKTSLVNYDEHVNIIKQLQDDIMTTYPSITISDSYIFDFTKLTQFTEVLDCMFKHVYVEIND